LSKTLSEIFLIRKGMASKLLFFKCSLKESHNIVINIFDIKIMTILSLYKSNISNYNQS